MAPRIARFSLLLAAAVCALGLSACFKKKPFHTFADTEGIVVQAGPLSYQVQVSRELNPFSTEDSNYLKGLPALTSQPTPQQEWFAVWMRAENLGKKPARMLTDQDYSITDTQGNVYKPIPLTGANPVRYAPIRVPAHTTVPLPDSIPYSTPPQGELLLFKINISAYQNRPLTLHLLDPSATTKTLAEVSLDL